MNKLQIRAEVLMIIKNIQTLTFKNEDILAQKVQELSSIEDKTTLGKIMIGELNKASETTRNVLIFLMCASIERDELEKILLLSLKDESVNDYVKAIILDILRDLGFTIDQNYLENFSQSVEEIETAQTQLLIDNANLNPEAQIDFLDFVYSLSQEDQDILLSSLIEDFQGDALANIIGPLALSKPENDLPKKAAALLAKSDSYKGIYILKLILKYSNDKTVMTQAKKSLNILLLKGYREEKEPKEIYKDLLEITTYDNCFVSIPDGNNNWGILYLRRHKNGNICLFATVINTYFGIVDCFGFYEVSEYDLERILNKFYGSQTPISISPEKAIKFFEKGIQDSYDLKGQIPYEFACWIPLTYDIPQEEGNFWDLIQNGRKDLNLKESDVNKLIETDFWDKWFIEAGDNEAFDDFCASIDNLEIPKIEEMLNRNIDLIFNKTDLEILNDKLLISAYFSAQKGEIEIADILYSLSFESSAKRYFLRETIKKSIYELYLLKRAAYEVEQSSFNTIKNSKTDLRTIKRKIRAIEKAWC